MFIRFITEFRNEDDEIETGVFQAVGHLVRSSTTFDYDKERLENIRGWFNDNLEKPTKFTRSKSKNAPNVSLSWFKSTAEEHLKGMYDMKVILEKYDMVVEVLVRENPGYIVYEDDFQVSTIPFKDDKKIVK